jgi:hypothetical protein
MSDDTACACGTCPDCSSHAAPRPLDAAAWRHSTVRDGLLGAIGRVAIDGTLPLAGLTTRSLDDPVIALIDAFAGNLHILAWNAARLADDATLARSEDRQALVDLVALTGYRPRPALSATTVLSYGLDAFPGAPAEVTIPAGNRVVSMPKPGELPISFETDAPLVARPEWNSLAPVVPLQRAPVHKADVHFEVAGLAAPGKIGDMAALAIDAPAAGDPNWLIGQITALDVLADPARVRLTLGGTREVAGASPAAADFGRLVVLGARTAAFGANAPDPLLLLKPGAPGVDPVVDAIDAATKEWKQLVMTPPSGTPAQGNALVDLDGSRPEALPGRLMLFAAGAARRMGHVQEVQELTRKGFGLSSKVTRTEFSGFPLTASGADFNALVRDTAIYVETARVPLLATPEAVILPNAATLDQMRVFGRVDLPAHRQVLLIGDALDAVGQWETTGELAQVKSCVFNGDQPPTSQVTFTKPVVARFRSGGLLLLGNVVAASAGESQPAGAELLGSGDATRLDPRYPLSRGPLTQLPANTPQGYAPALEVRVGGRRYDLLPNLHEPPEGVHGYAVAPGLDGKSAIRFAGRLPTAINSVTALYRVGAGANGNLDAGRIATALAPTPGVRTVVNPVRADGGADPEDISTLRTAAPATLATLDRVVSLRDYEAFATGFRGVGKAQASELWIGMRRLVVLTIASSSLHQPPTDLTQGLGQALAAYAPAGRPMRIQGFSTLHPDIAIAYVRDPAFQREDVEAAVRSALEGQFGAPGRRFAEGLPRSAVLAATQAVPGVLGAVITGFSLGAVQPDNGRLLAPGPSAVRDPVTGAITYGLAGLLSIDPSKVSFQERPA